MLTNLHPGMSVFENERGVCVLRLHYDADPQKAGIGQPKEFVPEIKRELSPWALAMYKKSPSPSYFLQELEVEFEATQGEKVYFLYPEATLEVAFPIPPDWTRYFILDPHPGVPHMGLWAAVDPWGDIWVYRELWPSKIYGKKGNCPADDNRVTPREFVEVMKWLESAENPESVHNGKAFDESFHERIIDYAARGFGHTANGGADQSNYQERFEAAMLEFELDMPYFKDCIKQGDAGADVVNEWLKPRDVDDGRNGWTRKSRLHIFQERCPELILQLNSNRRQQLTATQADTQDPSGKPIAKRNHATDCIAEGTLVTTMRGDVAIESVTTDDRVMTRSGWRRVLDAWKVSESAKVLEVLCKDGTRVAGTPDHRVFVVDKGWVSIDTLEYGDILVSCKERANQLSFRGEPTDDTPTHYGSLIDDISATRTASPAGICTATFGNQSTGQSRADVTFTTKTETRSTTTSPILSACRTPSTHESITNSQSASGSNRRSSTPFGIWPLLGMSLTKAASGIRKILSACGRTRLRTQLHVPGAEQHSAHSTTVSTNRTSVVEPVGRAGAITRELTTKLALADAESNLPSISTSKHSTAHANAPRVLAVLHKGTAAVYDLTVEGEHEFFAGGILVHNCLKYLVAAEPTYIPPMNTRSNWKPAVKGIAY